jgi:large subunit ribosomal protein L22
MQAVAKLKNLPVSPRKVRLVADLIRGASATQGLAILKHASKKCSIHLEKLLLSAVSNWEHKNVGVALEEVDLRIKEIWVDGASMLKRLRPAPQGRAHRIKKRSSHITLIVDGTNKVAPQPVGMAEETLVKPTNQIESNTDGAEN